jgi:hypothetical protein
MNSYEKQMVVLPCARYCAGLETRGASLHTGLSVHLYGRDRQLAISRDIESLHNGRRFAWLLRLDNEVLDKCKLRYLSPD